MALENSHIGTLRDCSCSLHQIDRLLKHSAQSEIWDSACASDIVLAAQDDDDPPDTWDSESDD